MYSISRRISFFDGLNFDCLSSINAFNCTNKFCDPYLPIHCTTFMYGAAIYIKAVYSREHTVKRSLVEIF